MLTLKELYHRSPEKITPEILKRIQQDPNHFEIFLREHLIEAEDRLEVVETPLPWGVQKEFIATRPDGKWRKQTLIIPESGEEGRRLLQRWALKQQTLTAYKWQLSGRQLEDWDLATPDNIDGIRQDISRLTRAEKLEAEEDWRRSHLIWGQKKN